MFSARAPGIALGLGELAYLYGRAPEQEAPLVEAIAP
jgi:hypothetical protein